MALSKVVNNSIESVDAAKLSGTIADARFPATLPAISGANLTNMAGGGFTLLAEQATTSGTGVTFSSIPSGTKMIVINLLQISLSSGDDLVAQLGDAGGIETTSYRGVGFFNSSKSTVAKDRDMGFWMGGDQATAEIGGSLILTLANSSTNEWVGQVGGFNDGNAAFAGGGRKMLSGELTQVKVLPSHGNSFDNGSVSLMYL